MLELKENIEDGPFAQAVEWLIRENSLKLQFSITSPLYAIDLSVFLFHYGCYYGLRSLYTQSNHTAPKDFL